jgi:hypothetical protein
MNQAQERLLMTVARILLEQAERAQPQEHHNRSDAAALRAAQAAVLSAPPAPGEPSLGGRISAMMSRPRQAVGYAMHRICIKMRRFWCATRPADSTGKEIGGRPATFRLGPWGQQATGKLIASGSIPYDEDALREACARFHRELDGGGVPVYSQ